MENDDIRDASSLSRQGSYSVIHNQKRFLDFASKQEKKMLSELSTSCYEAYIQDLNRYLAQINTSLLITNPKLADKVRRFDWQFIKRKGTALDVYNALMSWSRRWNLDADWVREYAVRSMEDWTLDSESTPEKTWTWNYGPGYLGFWNNLLFPELSDADTPFGLSPYASSRRITELVEQDMYSDFIDDPELAAIQDYKSRMFGKERWKRTNLPADCPSPLPPPPIGYPVWHDRLISRKDYLADLERMTWNEVANNPLLASVGTSHINKLVKVILRKGNTYCREVKRYRKAQGEHGKTGEIPLRDLGWAVAFQVQGKTFMEIAKESNITTQAVVKKVRAVLKQINLNERPDVTPGRPRGRKDSPLAPRQTARLRHSSK